MPKRKQTHDFQARAGRSPQHGKEVTLGESRTSLVEAKGGLAAVEKAVGVSVRVGVGQKFLPL